MVFSRSKDSCISWSVSKALLLWVWPQQTTLAQYLKQVLPLPEHIRIKLHHVEHIPNQLEPCKGNEAANRLLQTIAMSMGHTNSSHVSLTHWPTFKLHKKAAAFWCRREERCWQWKSGAEPGQEDRSHFNVCTLVSCCLNLFIKLIFS